MRGNLHILLDLFRVIAFLAERRTTLLSSMHRSLFLLSSKRPISRFWLKEIIEPKLCM